MTVVNGKEVLVTAKALLDNADQHRAENVSFSARVNCRFLRGEEAI